MTTLDRLRCRNVGCGRSFAEHTIPFGPDAGDIIRLPGVDYDAPERQVGVEARFNTDAVITGLYCPPGPLYNVAAAGSCPACNVEIVVTGGGAERLPDAELGEPTDTPGKCLCGAEVPLRWVGFALAPFTPVDELEADDVELGLSPEEFVAATLNALAEPVPPELQHPPGPEWP